MTFRLHADPRTLRARLGADFLRALTYPGIFRGAPLSVMPVLIDLPAGDTGLVIGEADSDACRLLNGPKVVTHGRYFDWNRDMGAPVTGFAEAVRSLTGPAELVVDPCLPAQRLVELAAGGPVSIAPDLPATPLARGAVFACDLPRHLLEAAWGRSRDADAARLMPYIRGLAHGGLLAEAAVRPMTGYAPLDRLCHEAGLSALLVSAPHEVEMFSGLPAALNAELGLAALFRPDAGVVTLLSPAPLERLPYGSGPVRSHPGIAAALDSDGSGDGRLGVQMTAIPADLWTVLQAAAPEMVDGAAPLRRWQDLRAGDDLCYFIFAANAVLEGIGAATAAFHRLAPGGALTERDLAAVFRDRVDGFAAEWGFAGRTSPCFDIVHSGGRTLLPATAIDYPVGLSDRTIKFDMGIYVHDSAGCVRGVSDIARTICTDPELAAIHDALRRTLIERLIPAIRPGMTGAQIHRAGLDALAPLEPALRAAGLLPEGRSLEEFSRDCGHTLQRQTISSVYFLPGVAGTVEAGQLGCVEYVWPVGDVLIAVEDGWVAAPGGTIPFTLAAEPRA